MIARMLATTGESLDEVVERLPEFHKTEEALFCPIHRKGAVMRAVTEAAAGLSPDLTEGVRVITSMAGCSFFRTRVSRWSTCGRRATHPRRSVRSSPNGGVSSMPRSGGLTRVTAWCQSSKRPITCYNTAFTSPWRPRDRMNSTTYRPALIVVFGVLGLLIAIAFNTNRGLAEARPDRASDLVGVVRDMETRRDDLEKRLSLLRSEMAELEQAAAADSGVSDTFSRELEQAREAGGLRASRDAGSRSRSATAVTWCPARTRTTI